MKDFEASAEPLQECLNATELAVHGSSTRLHDLTAKKLELHKLQVLMSKIHQAWNKAIIFRCNNQSVPHCEHDCSFHLQKLTIPAQLRFSRRLSTAMRFC